MSQVKLVLELEQSRFRVTGALAAIGENYEEGKVEL